MKLSKCHLTKIARVISGKSISLSIMCHRKAWGLNTVNNSKRKCNVSGKKVTASDVCKLIAVSLETPCSKIGI